MPEPATNIAPLPVAVKRRASMPVPGMAAVDPYAQRLAAVQALHEAAHPGGTVSAEFCREPACAELYEHVAYPACCCECKPCQRCRL